MRPHSTLSGGGIYSFISLNLLRPGNASTSIIHQKEHCVNYTWSLSQACCWSYSSDVSHCEKVQLHWNHHPGKAEPHRGARKHFWQQALGCTGHQGGGWLAPQAPRMVCESDSSGLTKSFPNTRPPPKSKAKQTGCFNLQIRQLSTQNINLPHLNFTSKMCFILAMLNSKNLTLLWKSESGNILILQKS